jgi:hypothetical protein
MNRILATSTAALSHSLAQTNKLRDPCELRLSSLGKLSPAQSFQSVSQEPLVGATSRSHGIPPGHALVGGFAHVVSLSHGL